MHSRIIEIFVFLFCLQFATCQTSDFGTWMKLGNDLELNDRWKIESEIQYRDYGFIGDLQQFSIKTGAGYDLTENNNNFLVGYAFVRSGDYLDDEEKVLKNEQRIYQQFSTKQKFGVVAIQHKYRVEQRFSGSNFKMRFRYALKATIPLNNKSMLDKTIYAVASNEILINGKGPTFDSNRLYGGFGYVFNKYFKVEAGFLSQKKTAFTRNQIQISLSNSLSLKKKN